MGVRGAAANACCTAAEPLMSTGAAAGGAGLVVGAAAGADGSAGGLTTLGSIMRRLPMTRSLLTSHHLNDMKQRYAMLACAMKSETL